jgi:GNAT superfamily N-acetyltransferase
MQVKIRKAVIEDAPTVFNLIKKMAHFDRRKPEEIKVTLELILEHCFGKRPYFEVLLAETVNGALGFALYFFTYTSSLAAPILYMEDLFVEEEFHKQGIGKLLISHLAVIALENKCCRIQWNAVNWNENGLQFYAKIGAKQTPDLIQHRLEGDELHALTGNPLFGN